MARGSTRFNTGIPFFDHMLAQLARHGQMDLKIEAKGDLEIDGHHTVEDVGWVLGQALYEALGDRRGIVRFGHAYVPLDEALTRVVVDLSGRPYLVYKAEFKVRADRRPAGGADRRVPEGVRAGRQVQPACGESVRTQSAPYCGNDLQGDRESAAHGDEGWCGQHGYSVDKGSAVSNRLCEHEEGQDVDEPDSTLTQMESTQAYDYRR